MTSITVAYDCTHTNLMEVERLVPKGSQMAGYSTGSPDIVWTPADWSRHPGALHIDQDHLASDFTADYLDVENGAATPAEAPHWYANALTNFNSAKRPGQRHPSIYMSANSVTSVANALINAGIHSGPGLIVADWNLTEAQAVQDVLTAAGPFPIVGVQFRNVGPYDINVLSGDWVTTLSGQKHVPPPPGDWDNAKAWSWAQVDVIGVGLDGRMHAFHLDPATNTWVKVQ